MTVWCHLPTIFKQRHALRIAGLLSLCVALTTTLVFAHVSHAAAGINQTISFQGRLQYPTGGSVADGHYNIQFKIYQGGSGTLAGDSDGGTLKWTESYINNGGTSGVDVKNGYFSVELGSRNAFGTNINWNDDTIWLSMNVAGSSSSCTVFGTAPCTADGEMLPMQRMTAVPYALNAGALGGKAADNFVQLAQGVQTDANSGSSIFINKTGSGNLLQLQNAGTDVYTLDSSGNITLGNNGNHSISVATAGSGQAGSALTLAAGAGGAGSGSAGGNLVLSGGNGGGTNGNGGNLVLSGGTATGSGTNGRVTLGSTLTLNSAASNPGTGSSLLGSMYYDTTLGKVQCYEAKGWGSCGSAPDNIVTISPEYTNAVMHGTGVGTMTSDLCSDALDINDATHGTPICGTNETYNFYKWTSSQTTAQNYSIYVTYQLPSTFKSFTAGSTYVKGRTDNGSGGGSASLQYTVYKNSGAGGGLTKCNTSPQTISSGTQTTWQAGTATGNTDPSTCNFAAGDSIVLQIDMSSSKNATAYVTDLGFTFSNN